MSTDGLTPKELRRLRQVIRQEIERLATDLGDFRAAPEGSGLALIDGLCFPRDPASTHLYNSLASAVAHLKATEHFGRQKHANRLTVWSLLRPALISASTAVWLLASSPYDKIAGRMAGLSREHLLLEQAFLRDARRIPGADVSGRFEYIRQKEADLNAWSSTRGVKSISLNPTNAIRDVANLIDPDREPFFSSLMSEMSSAAHGYGWHIQMRTFGAGSLPVEGTSQVKFAIDLNQGQFLDHLGLVTEVTQLAVSLFNQLRMPVETQAQD